MCQGRITVIAYSFLTHICIIGRIRKSYQYPIIYHYGDRIRQRKEIKDMRQIVLSILVENTPGVLSRISGLFTRRGYNIDSITACMTQDQKFSRITIAVSGDDMILKQIKNQLSKLEDVVKIFELENSKSVCRELILAKIRANKTEKQEVITIADIFRAKVVDVSKDNLMIELTGNVNKIEAFINLLSDFEVIEIVRTGITGLSRGEDNSHVF